MQRFPPSWNSPELSSDTSQVGTISKRTRFMVTSASPFSKKNSTGKRLCSTFHHPFCWTHLALHICIATLPGNSPWEVMADQVWRQRERERESGFPPKKGVPILLLEIRSCHGCAPWVAASYCTARHKIILKHIWESRTSALAVRIFAFLYTNVQGILGCPLQQSPGQQHAVASHLTVAGTGCM